MIFNVAIKWSCQITDLFLPHTIVINFYFLNFELYSLNVTFNAIFYYNFKVKPEIIRESLDAVFWNCIRRNALSRKPSAYTRHINYSSFSFPHKWKERGCDVNTAEAINREHLKVIFFPMEFHRSQVISKNTSIVN